MSVEDNLLLLAGTVGEHYKRLQDLEKEVNELKEQKVVNVPVLCPAGCYGSCQSYKVEQHEVDIGDLIMMIYEYLNLEYVPGRTRTTPAKVVKR